MTATATPRNDEAVAKMLKMLRRYDQYLVQAGRQLHEAYPIGPKLDLEVWERITVAIPLPVAMVLMGLGTALLQDTPAEAEVPNGG